MKLLRHGPLGAEKPGALDANGQARDLSLLWFALVVRREHLRPGVTPLAHTPADPANRIYPSPPRP